MCIYENVKEEYYKEINKVRDIDRAEYEAEWNLRFWHLSCFMRLSSPSCYFTIYAEVSDSFYWWQMAEHGSAQTPYVT